MNNMSYQDLQAQLDTFKEKEKQYLALQEIHEQVVKGLETQISTLQEQVKSLEVPKFQTIHYRN